MVLIPAAERVVLQSVLDLRRLHVIVQGIVDIVLEVLHHGHV